MLHLFNNKSKYEEYEEYFIHYFDNRIYKYYFSKEFKKLGFTGTIFKKPYNDDSKVINLDYTDNQLYNSIYFYLIVY